MAKRKKQAKKKIENPVKNLWTPKRKRITGLAIMLFTAYVAIAVFSYLNNWRVDQDKVMHWTWAMFSDDTIEVKNMLGKLGAVLSHNLVFWGFGLPTIIAIYFVGRLAYLHMALRSIKPWFKSLFNGLIIMTALSVAFAFAFSTSEFPWGGTFGYAICHWLSNFIGQIGLFLLLTTLAIGYFTWVFDINWSEFSFGNVLNRINWNMSWQPIAAKIKGSISPDEDMKTAAMEPFHQPQMSFTGQPQQKDPILQPTFVQQTLVGDTPVEPQQQKPPSRPVTIEQSFEAVKPSAPKKPSGSEELEEMEISSGGEIHPKLAIEEDNNEAPLGSLESSYDPRADLSHFVMPKIDFLVDYSSDDIQIDRGELEEKKNQIIQTLQNYKIEITKIRATIGPTVTLYEIVPAPGIRISNIKKLEDDIALSLAALGIRIIAPIPGKGTIGIEVPNKMKQTVALKELFKSEKYANTKMDLPIALGKTISNEVFVADLAKMPHLLVAGATGQGKSVGVNVILMSLLYKKHPSEIKFVLIDPKKVELFPYSLLKNHYMAMLPEQDEPIITDTAKVVNTLNSLCIEMDTRYDLLKQARARNIKEYNKKFLERKLNPNEGHKYMPFLVLVIDEFADLIMTAGKEVEMPIARLAQLARAVGMHLIIATQRPSTNIITGIIKANFPARIAFKVTSKTDSRVVLDANGADQLIGRGDMLLSIGGNVIRLQCAFVDTHEVESVIDHIGEQRGYGTPYMLPEYVGETSDSGSKSMRNEDRDVMFEEAARLVVSQQSGSTSMIQRRLKLGYNRAGRIMDQLEAAGIVGGSAGSKPREVLMYGEMELESFLEGIKASV